MAQDQFGAEHTERKLVVLKKYLASYATALKGQPFRTVYFDAFAGTGSIPQQTQTADLLRADDLNLFIEGSARRALSVVDPFDEYVFVERSMEKLVELKCLQDEFPHLAKRMRFLQGDANAEVRKFCDQTNWLKTRAVVFLDPYGNQVQWETVEKIAYTRAIDLSYLFPAGLGVHRQIGRDGTIHSTHEASLNSLLGTTSWKDSFIRRERTDDLFGAADRAEKVATPESITQFMIDRMKVPFENRVLERTLRLGSKGIHMYSLIFSCANPSPPAWRLASKLANAVMN